MLLLLACTRPDPDAAFRRHELDAAEAAWKARHGQEVSLDHHVADVLSVRAGRDPTLTMATAVEAIEAARLLEARPQYGLASLDLGFDHLEHLLGAFEALGTPPLLAVVGRSETPADQDPFLGGPLPYAGGRMLGWARRDLAALGRSVDAAPPQRLVTVALADGTGQLWLFLTWQDGGWWASTSTWPDGGVRLIRAAGELSVGAEALRQRYGAGLVPTGVK